MLNFISRESWIFVHLFFIWTVISPLCNSQAAAMFVPVRAFYLSVCFFFYWTYFVDSGSVVYNPLLWLNLFGSRCSGTGVLIISVCEWYKRFHSRCGSVVIQTRQSFFFPPIVLRCSHNAPSLWKGHWKSITDSFFFFFTKLFGIQITRDSNINVSESYWSWINTVTKNNKKKWMINEEGDCNSAVTSGFMMFKLLLI